MCVCACCVCVRLCLCVSVLCVCVCVCMHSYLPAHRLVDVRCVLSRAGNVHCINTLPINYDIAASYSFN